MHKEHERRTGCGRGTRTPRRATCCFSCVPENSRPVRPRFETETSAAFLVPSAPERSSVWRWALKRGLRCSEVVWAGPQCEARGQAAGRWDAGLLEGPRARTPSVGLGQSASGASTLRSPRGPTGPPAGWQLLCEQWPVSSFHRRKYNPRHLKTCVPSFKDNNGQPFAYMYFYCWHYYRWPPSHPAPSPRPPPLPWPHRTAVCVRGGRIYVPWPTPSPSLIHSPQASPLGPLGI